jgi:hypothetical protein
MSKLLGDVVIIIAGGMIPIAGTTATAIVVAYVFALVIGRRLLGRPCPVLTEGM